MMHLLLFFNTAIWVYNTGYIYMMLTGGVY